MKRSPAEWNALDVDSFTALLGGVYEHSPWIARAAAALRPFATLTDLKAALRAVVDKAPAEDRLALIRAHPDLAGKLAQLGQVTAESRREQAAAGLDALSPEDLRLMEEGNAAYRAKFGFPFIICARRHSRDSILKSMSQRLLNDAAMEELTAITEIHHIAELRTEDLLCQEN